MKYIIDSIVENGGVSEQTYEYCFRFETAAQIACEAIYQIVHDVTGYKKHYVTVYKRFQKKENTSCPRKCPKIRNCDKKGVRNEWTQMVACYHEDGNESTSSNQEHCFYYYEDDDTQKQHFYIHFFKENRTGVEIITGEDNIRERFLFHRSTKDREEQIKQYIGIPLYYAEENMDGELEANVNTEERDSQHVTYAVIQIDFRETGILGSTNEAIKEFVDNVFKSIVAYLNTSMQVDNLTRSFLNQIAWVSNVTNNVMYDQLMEAESELDKLWEKNEQLRKKCKEKTKHKR